MIVASAQTCPERFDTKANLTDHCRLIELAASNGAELILFPELSVTGYKSEGAREPVFTRKGKVSASGSGIEICIKTEL